MQPQNPPMEAKSTKPQVKKSATILKQLKAQDKKAETKEVLKKGMDEFFSKQASKATPKAPKSRAVSVPPPKLPTPSFDEIAAQLDQDSFLDNPVDRKRDTRRREAASMRGNATSVGATPASNRSVSARPPSGARVLKTQRADSEGRRRTTLNTMVR